MKLTENKKIAAIMNQSFGDTWLVTITDIFGYQSKVKNEDYVPAVGSAQIVDPEWEKPEDFDEVEGEYPMVDNPDYVAPVGEPTNDNPVTREMFLEGVILDKGLTGVLDTVLEYQVRQFRAEVAGKFKQVKEAIKTIN